jgi:hypothetical protein
MVLPAILAISSVLVIGFLITCPYSISDGDSGRDNDVACTFHPKLSLVSRRSKNCKSFGKKTFGSIVGFSHFWGIRQDKN